MKTNKDNRTVKGFGDEWERFDQSELNSEEHKALFDNYFQIFPWEQISNDASGFDMGCGSGRWARLLAPRVGVLHCFDPSSAIEVAKRNLINNTNCVFYKKGVGDELLKDETQDFGISLGVLHHVPDTQEGLNSCVRMLKPNAPFLLYLYYSLDNRPRWFIWIWRLSNVARLLISRLPMPLRFISSQMVALIVYLPLARLSLFLEFLGMKEERIDLIPLSAYRRNSFYTIRTDSLDRMGTRLEQRFSKQDIKQMMEDSGLERIEFHPGPPYWIAVGYKKEN